MTAAVSIARAPRVSLGVVLAFAAIYFVWGSTYVAIRVGVATFPPLLLAAARFLVSGTLLFAFARPRASRAPTRGEWRTAGVTGALMLLGGHGLLCWAEQFVPAGLAALLSASLPLWTVLLSWLLVRDERPSLRALLGVGAGFVAMALLAGPVTLGASAERSIGGALGLVLSSALWALGLVRGRRGPTHPDLLLAQGMQLLSGGAMLLVAACARGELGVFRARIANGIDLAALGALAWLVIFGTVLAFGVYAWMSKHVSPVAVSTHGLVNPIVAVGLGALLLGERLGARDLGAGLLIMIAVALILTRKKRIR